MDSPLLETFDSIAVALAQALDSQPAPSDSAKAHDGDRPSPLAESRYHPYSKLQSGAELRSLEEHLAREVRQQLKALIDLRDNKLPFVRELLDKLAQCPICFETMRRPYFVPSCRHAFCSTCLKAVCKRAPSTQTRCPMCRGPIAGAPIRLSPMEDALHVLLQTLRNRPV
ncbi:unnamed protein product [Peniophora sp. CBMAI 1063]|nr:unnamed protein product [Peniophora sp. CBMAI 1063]